ncbi:hypothetical protein ANN_06239 [Periplaneta americana]|uniref:Sleeping Beauty transposase HTH domain-containing protein n=1 Tax=Periplaneta americana TaxID=6978 RepID=A0ABQ8TD07_PERAM|nr:hypothetical protein ANN_06239 [Periplaneta americana]
MTLMMMMMMMMMIFTYVDEDDDSNGCSVGDIRQKQRAVIEFLCYENETVGNIRKRFKKVYGDAAVDRSTVSRWPSRLSGERWHANIRDTPRSGRPVLHEVLIMCSALTTWLWLTNAPDLEPSYYHLFDKLKDRGLKMTTSSCTLLKSGSDMLVQTFTVEQSVLFKMGKSKELSAELKKTIVRLALKGYSLRKIGNIVNKSHSTIQYVVNKFKYRGFTANQKRKPKEKILNEREKWFKIRQIKSNPRLSVPKPRSLMTKTTRKTVSVTTVRRVLYKYGCHGRRIRKRPFEQEFWDSDETKINLFGSDGAHRVWKKKNEADKVDNNLPTVKHGGGVIMIWCYKSSKGATKGNTEGGRFGPVLWIEFGVAQWSERLVRRTKDPGSIPGAGANVSPQILIVNIIDIIL